MNRPAKLLGLVLLAVLLPFLVFTEDTRQIHCQGDVCELGPADSLLIPYTHGHSGFLIDSKQFVPTDKIPANTPFKEAWRGIYARRWLPFWAAILLGVVLPLGLLVAAVLALMKRKLQPVTARKY